jgi:hypothetical protein
MGLLTILKKIRAKEREMRVLSLCVGRVSPKQDTGRAQELASACMEK